MTTTRLSVRVWAALALAAMPATALAQAPLALTLEAAIARGLEQSPRLAEARARESAASAGVLARQADGRPAISAVAAVLRTNHVDEFSIRQPDGSLRVLFPDIPGNYRVRAEANVPLYTAGRVDALVRAAEADGRVALADRETTDADVRLIVAETYWGLVTARSRVKVLEQAMARADAVVLDAESRVAAGVAAPNEVLSAQAQRARQRVRLIQAGHEASLAHVTLTRLLALPVDQAIEPVTAVDVPTGLAAATDRPVPEIVSDALARRADRRGLLDRGVAFREAAAAAGALGRPRVAAMIAVEPARPNARFIPRSDRWNLSWDLALNVSWSVWDGGRSRAEQAAALAQADAARHRLRAFDAAVSIDVRARLLALDAARAAVRASAEAVAAATEAQRVLRERYRAGVATSTEVLDADLSMLEAELEQTTLAAGVRLAEARLMRATGGRP